MTTNIMVILYLPRLIEKKIDKTSDLCTDDLEYLIIKNFFGLNGLLFF